MKAVYRHGSLVVTITGPLLDLGRDRLDGMAGRNTYRVALTGGSPVIVTDIAEDDYDAFTGWTWLEVETGDMVDPGLYADRRVTLRVVLNDPDALIEARAERTDGGAA